MHDIENCICKYTVDRDKSYRGVIFDMSKRNSAARSAPCEATPLTKQSRRESTVLNVRNVFKSTYYEHAALYFDKASKKWMNLDSDADCCSSSSFKPITDDHSTEIMSDFVPQQEDSNMLEPGAAESCYIQPDMVS